MQGDTDGAMPVGPDSLVWRHLGDRRLLLVAARAVLLQLAHPAVDAAVAADSPWVTQPWVRSFRALPEILGVVYDGAQAAQTADRIRRLHRPVNRVDEHGRHHHALDPEAFYWSHAVFVESVIVMLDLFDHPLTAAEKEQIYQESRHWYRKYGVSERTMPLCWEDFDKYVTRTCAGVLANTPAVLRTKEIIEHPARARHPWLPDWIWRLTARPATTMLWLVARGTVTPAARRRLGLEWICADDRKLQALAAVVRLTWRYLPRRVRYVPRARAAFSRTGTWPSHRRRPTTEGTRARNTGSA